MAQVTISGGAGGNTLCAGGGYVTLSPIVITETAASNFNVRTFVVDTLNLALTDPAFEFEPNSGGVTFTGTGSSAVLVTLSVTATKVAIRIVEGDNTNNSGINTITISGLKVRATAPVGAPNFVTRISSLQEFAINGLPVGTNLASVAGFAPPTVDAGSDEIFCPGGSFNFGSQSTGASASGGTDIAWTHNGTGSLTNASTLTPTYTPGPSESGVVRFTIQASNSNGSCGAVSDFMEVAILEQPQITVQPLPQTVCEGGTIQLSVTATGTGLSYEWFRGATSVGTSSTLTITNASSVNAGSYTVVVKGTCDATGVTSTAVAVVVEEAPEVTAHPSNQTVCEGQSTTLTVNAGSTSAPVYQWQVNRNDGSGYVDLVSDAQHSGVTTATLNLQSTLSTQNGYLYRARITSSGVCSGSALSDAATLTVRENPVITVQPLPQTVCEGSTIQLSVTATGTGLSYEWFRGATSVGTSSTLTITNASSANAGSYTVVVKGTCDATGVTSPAVAVVVEEAPEVITHPSNQTVCEGQNTMLTVNAGSTSAPAYQWQVNRNDGAGYVDLVSDAQHSGVTTTTLNLQNTLSTQNGYLYRARITSSGVCSGSALSNAAVLTVRENPVITVQPLPQTVCEGSTIQLSVTATGTGLSYEWFRGATSVGTSSTLTITNASSVNAGSYTVVVKGTCDATGITSTVVAVVVEEAPEVTAHPSNQTVCEGQSTTLTVNAGSTSAPVYQWQVNRNDGAGYVDLISDAQHSGVTTATLDLQNTLSSQNGYLYRARITSSGVCSGSALSDAATLTVRENPVITVQPLPQTVCEGSTIQLSVTATGTGLSYEWFRGATSVGTSSTLTITNATSANAGSYTVVVKGTCDATGVTSTAVAVVVEEAPEVTAHPSNQTVCEGQNTTLTVNAGSTTSPVYQWQVNRNDGAGYVDLISDAQHSGVTTTTLDLQNTLSTQNGYLYRARITSSGVCSGSALSDAATLTVRENPVITVQPVASPFRCQGESITLSVTAQGTGLLYQWQKDGSDVGPLSTVPLLTLTNLTVADAGTYTVIVSGTCTPPATSSSSILTVQPLPVVTNSHDQLSIQICSEESLTFVPLFSIPGTTFNWESQQTAQITGGVTASGSDFTTQAPQNDTNVPGTVTYNVTPTVNSCAGQPFNFVVTVKPLPSAYANNEIICSGSDTGITLTPSPKNVSGTSFAWIATPSNVSGAADGNGSSLNQNLTTDENGGSVIYAITPSANGCIGPVHNLTVTVNALATATAGPDEAYCEPGSIILSGTIGGSANTGTWTVDGTAAGTISMDPPSGNTVTATYSVSPADHNKTFSFYLTTDDPDGLPGPCSAAVDEKRITIHELPEVALSELRPQYAENDPVQFLSGFPTANGTGVFTGPGIVAGSNEFNPANANIGINQITYTFKSSITGCENSDTKVTVVNALTDIDFDLGTSPRRHANGDLLVCQNLGVQPVNGYPAPSTGKLPTRFISEDGLLTLTSSGGDWFLDTDNLVPGEYIISYEYTNQDDATQKKIKRLIVFETPVAEVDMQSVCTDASVTFNHSSQLPADGAPFTYFWTFGEDGQTSSLEAPQYAYSSPGSKTVTLRVTTGTGCSHMDSESIAVGQPPVVDFGYTKRCSEVQATEFADATPASPFYNIIRYQWDFADGNPAIEGDAGTGIPAGTHGGTTSGIYNDPIHRYSAFGTYPVQLTVTTAEGCVASIQKNVYILDYNIPEPTMAYRVDFENGPAGWVDVPPNNGEESWVLGTPAGNLINSASSGSNAWWTGSNPDVDDDNSFYYRNENSEVLGPCLNLSAIQRPMISLRYWSDTPLGYDGAVLQYSVDGAENWTTVGDAEGAGINWYNARNMASDPGGQDNHAWSDSTMGWRTARFSLDQIDPQDRHLVLFRIAFSSTEKGRGGLRPMEGFAFDDIYIGEKTRNVLVENFTNAEDPASAAGRTWFETMYNEQIARRGAADFIVMQYHMANPVSDPLNADNPVDPFSRAQWYGVANPPAAVMDGIQGAYFGRDFNGSYNRLTAMELDRRSLEDPLFDIAISLDNTGLNEPLTGTVEIDYTGADPLTTPVMVHGALVENGIGTNMNVLRKLVWGPSGRLFNGPFESANPPMSIELNFPMNAAVADPDNLYLIVFVQEKNTKRILQSRIIKVPSKQSVIVGVPEDPDVNVFKHLSVYPNPAAATINFALDKVLTRQYQWQIIDQRGVTVTKGLLNSDLRDPQTVDISELSNGIYFLAIRTGDRAVFYRKIAVMNR